MNVWQATPDPDADVRPCQRCEKPVVLDHHPACQHGVVACPECGAEAVCPDCRKAALMDMCASGEYDPRKDPFYLPTGNEPKTLAEVLAQQRDDVEAYTRATGYDPRTNSYRPRGKK